MKTQADEVEVTESDRNWLWEQFAGLTTWMPSDSQMPELTRRFDVLRGEPYFEPRLRARIVNASIVHELDEAEGRTSPRLDAAKLALEETFEMERCADDPSEAREKVLKALRVANFELDTAE